ncbi:LLM class flavin-dependent oxidoreductase [Amycolatopsis sp. AA4]|uniref:LLM class flavin-dependent oxidoreductase n=1 Tax=Actinomycetes TaxID=1760 RepID=UPI0001B5807F|nr:MULTISPECIES: LLM class flavin-dependent oxidoreductase [Actinomycetes]ATY12376.1 LLM class flavin-dependent oxidoreductase [Amycolatopsis sp. AA4]
MPQFGVSMPVLQTPFEKFAEFAQLADSAGFRSLWLYEYYRNPFVVHAGAAGGTDRISLGTAVAQAFTRSPFELANAAADLDEASSGRTLLGIGAGLGDFLDSFHSVQVAHPVRWMSEYIDTVRMSWDYHSSGLEPMSYDGTRFSFRPMPLNPAGARALRRPRIPIYLAALRPLMLQLAGEKAEGMITMAPSRRYVDRVILPNLRKGARRSGRHLADFDLTALTICSISDDRAEAVRRARIQVGVYAAMSELTRLLEFDDCEREQHEIQAALGKGGLAAVESAVSDKLVELYTVAGTPDEVREQVRRFAEYIPHIMLAPPYIPPLTADESEDAFLQIIKTFGD